MKKLFNLIAILIIISMISVTLSLLLMDNNEKPFVIPEGTKFIAHRGLSSQYFENSEQAFLGAAQTDFFFGIETDIWLTTDGVWVCAHDVNPFIDSSKNITDLTFNEIKTLALDTSNFEYSIPDEEIYICSFERYLDICIDYNKMPVIELKYIPKVDELNDLLSFIEQRIAFDRIMFISFHNENISNLKEINPELRLMTLANKTFTAGVLSLSGDNAGVKSTLVTQELINNIKENGSLFNVWTVNDKEEAQKFIEWNVDFITTDFIFDL